MLDPLVYVGLYKFPLRMTTSPVLTALEICRHTAINWTKMAVQYGFAPFNFHSGEMF